MVPKVLLAIFLLILVYVFSQFLRTRHFISIGEGLAAEAVAYEQHPEDPSERVLFIGDSSAVGTGSSEPALSTAGRYGANHPNADIRNLAVNGSKTHELVPRLTALDGQQFDLIVIQIGGNDIVRFTDASEQEASLRSVLEIASTLSDRVLVLHGGNVGTSKLFPAGTRWIFTRRTRATREMYLRVLPEYGAYYVDIFYEPKDDPFSRDAKKYYSPDNFHPSEHGYGLWYEEIEKTLDALTHSK